ncbi:hypothetical protein SAMN03159434_102501 [Enterobacter sp. NFR05]|nr:hypothetical protein C9415_24745 [Kluyvera sp. Nf5]SLJ96141.1 hypothetical protein SAMN03159434_102501 [Enterobacter sp. NFR05]
MISFNALFESKKLTRQAAVLGLGWMQMSDKGSFIQQAKTESQVLIYNRRVQISLRCDRALIGKSHCKGKWQGEIFFSKSLFILRLKNKGLT